MKNCVCNYEGCRSHGTIPQTSNDGSVWAVLCAEHNAAMEKALQDGDAAAIMRHWVRALGGAKAAAERMMK